MSTNHLLLILMGTITPLAFAKPIHIPKRVPVEVADSFTSNHDFEGIIALSNCSGSLVRFETSKGSDSAIVMTNGHCLEGGGVKPNSFVEKKNSNRKITFLNKDAAMLGIVFAEQVIYATETGTDITLYKLKESYDALQTKFGVSALTLSSERPSEEMPIEIISGYWKKGYTCGISSFVSLLKEDAWSWTDSIRYSQPGCETIGGTSGSPIVQKGTKTIVGINNTLNEHGEKCTLNNPCEVDLEGNISYQKGHAYAQETYWIYSCLNENNELNLNQKGCRLFH